MKTCTGCDAEKPLSDFYKYSDTTTAKTRDGHFGECKDCQRTRAREWQRQKRAEPGYMRRQRLKTLYGITPEQYDAMLAEQRGGCAICGTADPQTGRGDLFPVDHDHETGEVRGLICQPCNTGLGGFKDDVDRLVAAAAYLLARQNVLGPVTF